VSDPALTKLGAARTRLVLDKPFIGALVMHLPLVPANARWCATVSTDARMLYFNPDYVRGLTLPEAQFVLAHEALHCALGHFARRSHRTRRRWDVACDHCVNLILLDEGLRAPAGALRDPAFRGLSAEEIYPLIDPGTLERTLDRHPSDAVGEADHGAGRGATPPDAFRASSPDDDGPAGAEGAGASAPADGWDDAGSERRRRGAQPPPAPPPDEAARLAEQWRGRLARAAQQAVHAGRMGDAAWRLVDRLIAPRLPWRVLLSRFLVDLARDDYSFQRPSRREGAAILPSLQSGSLDLFVAIDTSGSIGDEELRGFASEIDTLKGQVRARVTLHACDAALAADGPWTFEAWQPIELPTSIAGGGGTRFAPVFEWIAESRQSPDALLYFTDAEGDFPDRPPPYPVIWLVKGAAAVPWGERIQLS
jgi:predicted metal-dependent peptidase